MTDKIRSFVRDIRDIGEENCGSTMAKKLEYLCNLVEVYDSALRLMVLQYCTRMNNDLGKLVYDHQFMCAGEEAFKLLGIKEGQQAVDDFENEYQSMSLPEPPET